MRFPIVIHKDAGSAYGVTVPALPGCFSAGDTLEEAIESAREADWSFLADVKSVYGHASIIGNDRVVFNCATYGVAVTSVHGVVVSWGGGPEDYATSRG